MRQPVVYLPHGGGPWPFVDLGMGSPQELSALRTYLEGIAQVPRERPKAVLMISAHWEESVPTLMTNARPPMLYDYFGFPPESYTITWPAPGSPELAARVQKLLTEAGFTSGTDAERGFDHGTFVPLKLAWPQAEVPCVQLSLIAGLDPQKHLALGQALAPLRDEGIFIIGSGMSFHNLRAFGPRGAEASEVFDAWLSKSVTAPASERNQLLQKWASAPAARAAHPREEHLLPLLVVAGAAGEDRGSISYQGPLMGVKISGYQFG